MADERIKEAPKIRDPEPIRDRPEVKKDGPSTFDKVLEQNRLLQKSPQQVQTNVLKDSPHEARVARHQEQGDRGKDKQSDEKEQERGKQKAREERKPGTEVDHRVMGKGQAKGDSDKSGGGKDGSRDGQGFGRALQKKTMATLKKSDLAKAAHVAAEATKFASALKNSMKAAHLSDAHLQQLVAQIVKFVKTGLNKEGDKEVRLDLSERIFKGLQLRVSMKDGKVAIQFNTSNAEVREIFTNSSGNIKKELEAKGILVRDIKVT